MRASGVVLDAKQHCTGTVDQHATQIDVAAFADAEQLLLAPLEYCRVRAFERPSLVAILDDASNRYFDEPEQYCTDRSSRPLNTFGMLLDDPIENEALRVRCPTCGVAPQVLCERVEIGGVRPLSHMERRRIAQKRLLIK